MKRWELLRDRDAESRIYLALLGQKKNVYTIFRDFGGKSNKKEIPGLYTRPYIEIVVKKLARAKILKTSIGRSSDGKRPVLLYESDSSTYSEYLRLDVGMHKDSVEGVDKYDLKGIMYYVQKLFPAFNEISTLPSKGIKKFDALFLITLYTYCAMQVSFYSGSDDAEPEPVPVPKPTPEERAAAESAAKDFIQKIHRKGILPVKGFLSLDGILPIKTKGSFKGFLKESFIKKMVIEDFLKDLHRKDLFSRESRRVPVDVILQSLSSESAKLTEMLEPIYRAVFDVLEKKPNLLREFEDGASRHLFSIRDAMIYSFFDTRKIPIYNKRKEGPKKGGGDK